MDFTHHFRSPIGGITLASDGDALTGLWFDGQKYFADTLAARHTEKELAVFEQADVGSPPISAEKPRIIRRLSASAPLRSGRRSGTFC